MDGKQKKLTIEWTYTRPFVFVAQPFTAGLKTPLPSFVRAFTPFTPKKHHIIKGVNALLGFLYRTIKPRAEALGYGIWATESGLRKPWVTEKTGFNKLP